MLHPGDLDPLPDILVPFPPQARAVLAQQGELRSFAAQERIFSRGEEADGLYMVRSGEIQIRLEAQRITWKLASIGPGGVVGEMSLLGTERRRTADAWAGGQPQARAHAGRCSRESRAGRPSSSP